MFVCEKERVDGLDEVPGQTWRVAREVWNVASERRRGRVAVDWIFFLNQFSGVSVEFLSAESSSFLSLLTHLTAGGLSLSVIIY